jgi:opacity protein-like surface antigen
MKRALIAAFVITVFAAVPARAQSDQPVHMIIGGGMVTPLSGVGDRFNTGGAFAIGFTFERTVPFGLQVEYGFNKLGGPEVRIPLMVNPLATPSGTAVIESHHKVHYFVASALFHTDGERRFNPYGLAGGGMYHRTVSLTTPDIGFTTYCDPYWYVCYPTVEEIDRVIGDRSTWDPGVNVGGGLAIRLGHAAAFVIEARWHYTWGPTFTSLDGAEQRANGNYFPVTFGFKF